jgi:putative endonuclease
VGTTRRSSRPKPRARHPSERRAARWYRLRGYRVVERNRWIAGYELDLVLCRGRTVVFCEVKSKTSTAWGDPIEMVTPEKVRRIRRAAEVWLSVRREYRGYAVRFDVVAVQGRELRCLPNAF